MSAVCRAHRGDLAALALDRLDADERTRLLAHVDGCVECRDALDELRAAAGALAYACLDHLEVSDSPPADLVERIARSARVEHRGARRARHRRGGRRARHRRLLVAGVGVAAALLLGLGFVRMARDGDTTPALQPFTVAPDGASVDFGLVRNDQGTRIVLRQSGLDPSRVYWMWLADESGRRYNAGTFRGAERAETITMQSALPLDETVRVWCTDSDTEVVLDSWVKR